MDYSQLSDFEINKRVGIALGKELMPDDCQDFGLSGFPEVMLRNGDIKDYCNDPTDGWPIIVSNHISLMHEESLGKWCAGKPYWVDGCEWQLDIDVMDENPLRAAMIFFLMMREAKHA
ncbi:phage protein NinX family protein [Enterobacter bugandensis]|uniref:phage protein NinX family protein n=1 Tax=Enterobacter bugandensis TaxID=881260 RepID=UPI002FCF9817